MNVTQLEQALKEAREKGLHPDTEVVLDLQGQAFDGNPGVQWYVLLDPAEHPLDGQSGVDLWFTLTPSERAGEVVHADARFTPGHSVIEDPVLHGEYLSEREESRDPDSVLFDSGFPPNYVEWLEDRYEGLAGALRDDPPRDRSDLADTYRALAGYLTELKRIDPS